MEKNKVSFLKLITSTFVCLVLLVSTSYAWFANRYESDFYPEIIGADFFLNIDFGSQGSTVTLSSGLPVSDAIGYNMNGYSLDISNGGNITVKTNIRIELFHNDSPYSLDPDLTLFNPGELRYALVLKDYEYIDPDDPLNTSLIPDPTKWIPTDTCNINSTNYDCIIDDFDEVLNEINIIPGETYNFEIKLWVNEDVRFVNNKVFFGRIVIDATQENAIVVSSNDANPPILLNGMIPVIWCDIEEGWIIVNEWDDRWYNYSETDKLDLDDQVIANPRRWANVVTVSSANIGKYMMCQPESGCILYGGALETVIPEEEITSMFVWIPRFRYTVKDDIADGNEDIIDVIWERGINESYQASATFSGNVPTNFYTASAFRELNRELYGFWMAKFQAGVDQNNNLVSYANSSMNTSHNDNMWNTIIKNNYEDSGETLHSLSYQNDDKAMAIKSSQWDAVSFLSQSRYGKYGFDQTGIFPNNNFNFNFEITSRIFHIRETWLFGLFPSEFSYTLSFENSSSSLSLKSGFVCSEVLFNNCLNPIRNHNFNSEFTTTNQSSWGSSTRTSTRITEIEDSISMNNVYYTNQVHGGKGSSTGNIYGVYDMFGAREEITNTIHVQTGYYHTHVSGFQNMLTFAIPYGSSSYFYISEEGKVYNEDALVAYENILNTDILIYNEFIILDNLGFNLNLFNYFQERYETYSDGVNSFIIEKGSSIYLTNANLSNIGLYNSRVDTTGSNYSFISRGGGLSGAIDVEINITDTSGSYPTYNFSVSGNQTGMELSPFVEEAGTFANFNTRNSPFNVGVTYNISPGSYTVNTYSNYNQPININSTSRVVIVV